VRQCAFKTKPRHVAQTLLVKIQTIDRSLTLAHAKESYLKPCSSELVLQRGHFALKILRDKSNRCLGDFFERYSIVAAANDSVVAGIEAATRERRACFRGC
jgi:hypothetical protein